MKFRVLLFILLGLISGHLNAHASIVWEKDYPTALAKSRATGKPLFIDFYVDWCGYCKRLDSVIYPDPRVEQLSHSYIMLRLNGEREGFQLAQAERITGYPTLMFVSSKGQQIARHFYLQPNDFLAVMTDSLRRNGAANGTNKMTLTPGTKNWRTFPELSSALKQTNYAGTLVLGDSGVVAVDRLGNKTRTTASHRKSPSKSKVRRH